MQPSSTQQFSGIFVSYRRDDSSGHAGRLADKLVEHFGRNRIFVDVDTIEPGEDFVTVIENAVGSCEILIAVIGRNWLAATGSGRLDNPNNFVRLEIATALRRDIRVIPVLVQRASMPKPQDLPEDLVKLTRRNAIEVSDLRWQNDVDQLISVMERVLAKRAEAEQLVEANHAGEEQPHQEVKENPLVDEPEPETDETAEDRQVAEAPVGQLNVATRENRPDTPATIVTAGTASPVNKNRFLMLIAGASLIVLLAVASLIWRAQRDPDSSSDTNQAATPQPALATQPTHAEPTSPPELTPSSTPDQVAFSEPTLWKRGDFVLEIIPNGNSLRAVVDSVSDTAAAGGRIQGDIAFDGTYEGRKFKGTAYLLFSPADVSRCPAFKGDQSFALELTLSADGNTLSGSREDYKLSAECDIITLPRRKVTYTKTSR